MKKNINMWFILRWPNAVDSTLKSNNKLKLHPNQVYKLIHTQHGKYHNVQDKKQSSNKNIYINFKNQLQKTLETKPADPSANHSTSLPSTEHQNNVTKQFNQKQISILSYFSPFKFSFSCCCCCCVCVFCLFCFQTIFKRLKWVQVDVLGSRP